MVKIEHQSQHEVEGWWSMSLSIGIISHDHKDEHEEDHEYKN